ncbi:MAG: DUF3299 domain-containing protein [Gammaproteobacteria bacterium]|nr:DUF3299 domain-containing protein [Gammaproteobacteria bacterium]
MSRFVCGFLLLTALLAGCDSSSQSPTSPSSSEKISPVTTVSSDIGVVRTLTWDDLMPADFDPGVLFKDVDISKLSDNDPQAQELFAKLRELWNKAPVVTALDGAYIRLPGFAIPLETDGQIATRFLLVPYIGACIHVPPPPLNQTVLVEAPMGARIQQVFDPFWVTGQLAARRTDTQLANAGYTLTATDVEPYKGERR